MIVINNPRKENGGFGDEKCDYCGCYSSAYILLNTTLLDGNYGELWRYDHSKNVCKGCLLTWVKKIDKVILNDCVKKGKRRNKHV